MNKQITKQASKIIEEMAKEIHSRDNSLWGESEKCLIIGMQLAITSPELLQAQGLSKDECVSVEDIKELISSAEDIIYNEGVDGIEYDKRQRLESIISKVETYLPQPPINK